MTTSALSLSPAAAEKPVKVYILSGQSTMVGIGQVTGGGTRWGAEFLDPVLSGYEGTYLGSQADGLGWIARMDIPGTLATVVKQDGKFPYLVDDKARWVARNDVWYKGVNIGSRCP